MRITIIATGFTKEIGGDAPAKVVVKEEKSEEVAEKAEETPAVEAEAPKAAPKKSADMDLDDFLGSMFGN